MTEKKKRASTSKRRPAVPHYHFKRYLCSAGEWRFSRVLEEAVGDEFDILFQVRVAAILRPARRDDWERDGRRVSQKAFDFVLVTKGTSHVRAAVELDDRTHELPERVSRDRFLEEACEGAGLPLARFKVVRKYQVEAVRSVVKEALGGDPRSLCGGMK